MRKFNTFKNVMISLQTATLYWIWCYTIPNDKFKLAIASIFVGAGMYVVMCDADRYARSHKYERRCR